MSYEEPNLTRSAVDHLQGDISDHEQSCVGDPPIPVQQRGDVARCGAHERNRQGESMIKMARCSRAAPATASTLSSDIDTSATTIWLAALANYFWGAWPAIVPSAFISMLLIVSIASRFHSTERRNSRDIFQPTPKQKDSSSEHEPHHLQQLGCGRGDRESGSSARL